MKNLDFYNMHSSIRVYHQKPDDFSAKVEVAAIYVTVQDRLLLLNLASNKSEAGAWGVPAGKLEASEEPLKGARRELFEETGILEPEEFFQSLGKLYMRKPDIDYVYHLFRLDLESMPSISLSLEHCAHRWVTRQEAESLPLMKGAIEALDFYYR